jgi:hypothetical protein
MMDSPLALDWAPEALPTGVEVLPAPLRTADGAAVLGQLYRAGRPRTVVCLMHPREYFGAHYLVPALLRAGVAVWTQGSRSIGLDIRLEHELAVVDAAAGIQWLRAQGFESIVSLGNSGGAGLYCYYTQQALLPASERVARTPAGRPSGLPEAVLPAPDAVVLLAPHPGQGRLLLGCIDPSVMDESDPFSVDPALDAFNRDNGYSRDPGQSRYSPEFIVRYRAAQRERVRRLDERARTLVAERQAARGRLKAKAAHPGDRQRAAHTPIVTVWRTDADLRCLDLSLDPSDRAAGSIWSQDMVVSNFGAVGFGRTCTPESWLSTWSGLSSHAALEKTAPALRCPTLVVEYTGDQTTFPSGIREIYEWIGAADKQHVRVRGDHHGRPLAAGETPGRALAGSAITEWLQDHQFV